MDLMDKNVNPFHDIVPAELLAASRASGDTLPEAITVSRDPDGTLVLKTKVETEVRIPAEVLAAQTDVSGIRIASLHFERVMVDNAELHMLLAGKIDEFFAAEKKS